MPTPRSAPLGSAMAFSTLFTQAAERDRDAIVDYLLETLQSRQAAGCFLDELDRLIEVLEELPESFPRAQDRYLAALDLRKAPCMNYLVLCRVEGDTVYLMRIFHQAQDYARLV